MGSNTSQRNDGISHDHSSYFKTFGCLHIFYQIDNSKGTNHAKGTIFEAVYQRTDFVIFWLTTR